MTDFIKMVRIVTKFKPPIKLRMGVYKSWQKNKKMIPFIQMNVEIVVQGHRLDMLIQSFAFF
jgi:hypothetical protein